MSVLGIVLGIIGIVASILGIVIGTPGAVIAGVIGLLAILIGVLTKIHTKTKGMRAVILGVIAIMAAVFMANGGIMFTNKVLDEVRAHPEKAPTIARYIDKISPSMALYGFVSCTDSKEDADLITEELTALMKDIDTKAPAAAEAPAENTGDIQG